MLKLLLCLTLCSALFFLSACGSGNAAVIRRHPIPSPSPAPANTEAQSIIFEARTRVRKLTPEEERAAVREAASLRGFTESEYLTAGGQILCMQFKDGWLYWLQKNPLAEPDEAVIFCRSNGVSAQSFDVRLSDESFYTYYFAFDADGSAVFLHAPQSGAEAGCSFSRYSVGGDGSLTATESFVAFAEEWRAEFNRPFIYNGVLYHFPELTPERAKPSLILQPLNDLQNFYERYFDTVYSSNGDSSGFLYVYYKNGGQYRFGIYDLNKTDLENFAPATELSYDLTNIYGALALGYNPLDGNHYRAANNQFRRLSVTENKWESALYLGEETEFQMLKDAGVKYDYDAFIINSEGEFFLAVPESKAASAKTAIYKYVMN